MTMTAEITAFISKVIKPNMARIIPILAIDTFRYTTFEKKNNTC